MNRAFVYSILVIVVSAVALQQQAQAQVKPFKITGAGVGTMGLPLPGEDPRPHWIVGEATHLGRHYGEGAVRTDSAEFDPGTGKITGEFGSGAPFVFVAADGDELVCHYGRTEFGAEAPGYFELTIVDILPSGQFVVEALWIAEFVPLSDQCTGRFAGVTGGWIMVAWSEPFVLGSNDPANYQWQGEGALHFVARGE